MSDRQFWNFNYLWNFDNFWNNKIDFKKKAKNRGDFIHNFDRGRMSPHHSARIGENDSHGKIDFFLILSSFSRWTAKITLEKIFMSPQQSWTLWSNLAGPQMLNIGQKWTLGARSG